MAARKTGKTRRGRTSYGLPPGHQFVPENLELLDILEHKLRDRSLDGVLHEVWILDFHPAKLYKMYAEDEEDGYIYFFITREFPGRKKMRPQRAPSGGQWKVFVYCQTVESDKDGGVPVGRKLTLEFYQRRFDGDNNNSVRTNWGMHEFVTDRMTIRPGNRKYISIPTNVAGSMTTLTATGSTTTLPCATVVVSTTVSCVFTVMQMLAVLQSPWWFYAGDGGVLVVLFHLMN